MASLTKKYNSKEVEKKILEFWDNEGIYKFDLNSKKPLFSIDTPPPTISGKMHIGHAYSYTQTDFIARYKRMRGYNVFYPFGTDDNGLPTEKLVQKEKKVNLRKLSREEAIKITLEYLDETRPEFISDWKKLGHSNDFSISYSTIDKHSQKISQESFLQLYEKGLIEQREGPIPWDRVFQTAIAQAELEDVKRIAKLNYIKAKIKGSNNTYVIYATTRPELCFAVVGMSIEDKGNYVKLKVGEEYWISGENTFEEKFSKFNYKVVEKLKGKDLIGQKVLIPIVNKEVEISHDSLVKADFGTGIAYFCTYGGVEDIEWASRHKVNPVMAIDKTGKLTKICGKYEGILASEAREKIITELNEIGNLLFYEEKEQIVNVGERSGAEVEFIVSKQWYVKYLDKKELFFEMAQKFNWHPEFMKHRLDNWIEGLNWDWGFSRQRHFGVPIPVWHCKVCGAHILPKKEDLPVDPLNDAPQSEKCKCGSRDYIPEEDVFDTWFTSASTPIIAKELVKDENIKKELFPMDLRPQAHDIINFWLFYTMAKTNLIYNKNPFNHVCVSGWVLDPKGNKMSKSKGNVVAPQDVVEKFSNDALRFAASTNKLGQDIPYSEKDLQTGIRIVNKLYNANKFASMLLDDFSKKDINMKPTLSIDKWILSKLQSAIKQSTEAFDSFDYQKARAIWQEFFMNVLADNYIEIVKERLWKKKKGYKSAQSTLYNTLYNSLKCLGVYVPFVAEEIYQNFYEEFESEKSIHLTQWPKVNEDLFDDKIIELGDEFIKIIEEVRKFKANNKVSMKAELDFLKIRCSKETQNFCKNSFEDLISVTGAKNISFEDSDKLEVDMKLCN